MEATESSVFLSSFIGPLSFAISLFFVFLYLVVLWLLLVKYVWEDARSRSEDLLFLRISLLLVVFFNFPGLLLYLILRPPLTFAERQRTLLEREILEYEVEKARRERQPIRNENEDSV